MRVRNWIAAFLVLGPATLIAEPAFADVLIEIDKGTQRMTVTVDGAPRYTWPVSTGTLDRATPAGSFQPFRLVAEHFSKEWDNAAMPHSIFFTQAGHAIHGSQAVARLGTPASHGCVRLSPSNATTLYGLVEWEGLQNTRVVITGTEPTQVAKAEPEVQGSPETESTPPTLPPSNPSGTNEDGSVFGDSFGDEPPRRRSDAQESSKPKNAPAARSRHKRNWIDEDESVFADSFSDGSPGEDSNLYSYHAYPDDYQPDLDPEREWN
jgi:hypothetical protein